MLSVEGCVSSVLPPDGFLCSDLHHAPPSPTAESSVFTVRSANSQKLLALTPVFPFGTCMFCFGPCFKFKLPFSHSCLFVQHRGLWTGKRDRELPPPHPRTFKGVYSENESPRLCERRGNTRSKDSEMELFAQSEGQTPAKKTPAPPLTFLSLPTASANLGGQAAPLILLPLGVSLL